MVPADEGSDDDRGSGIRRTDGWRGDVPFLELANRLGTTTNPLLTTMTELGLHYDGGRFYQRQEGSQEREMSKDEAFALLQPRFPSSGATEDQGDSTIPLPDNAILSAESAVPRRGPPPVPPRREEPAESGEPSVRVSETYVGQVDQLTRQHKLEELRSAVQGNNQSDHIQKLFSDYLALVPTNKKPDEAEVEKFFADAVAGRGMDIVGHLPSQLEKILEADPEAAGHFAVQACLGLYFDLPAVSVEEFVQEGLLMEDKVAYFSLQSEESGRVYKNLFAHEHKLLVRGEAALKAEAEKEKNTRRDAETEARQYRQRSEQNAAEARSNKDKLDAALSRERKWRRAAKGIAAAGLIFGAVVGSAITYEVRQGAIEQKVAEYRALQRQYTVLQGQHDEHLQQAKALQEGPLGQAWKKREEEYSALERVQKAWEKEAMESRDLVRSWRQTPAARISENIHDSQELSRITAEYVGKLGYIRIPGPGCERGLKNLHTALGGSKETEKGFVSALQSKGVCQGMAEDEPYLEFFKK